MHTRSIEFVGALNATARTDWQMSNSERRRSHKEGTEWRRSDNDSNRKNEKLISRSASIVVFNGWSSLPLEKIPYKNLLSEFFECVHTKYNNNKWLHRSRSSSPSSTLVSFFCHHLRLRFLQQCTRNKSDNTTETRAMRAFCSLPFISTTFCHPVFQLAASSWFQCDHHKLRSPLNRQR